MAKPVNRKCEGCAAQKSHEEAQQRPCWVGTKCVARRSHYRNRADRLAKKRAGYVRGRIQAIKRLDLPLDGYEPIPEAKVIYWRDRADGPIHAIGINVYEDGELAAKVEPKHCRGMHQNKLRRTLTQWQQLLSVQHGGKLQWSQVRLPAAQCPLCEEKPDADE